MEQRISAILEKFQTDLYLPEVRLADVVEVLILTFLIYKLIEWIKNTKAWMLLKGVAVLAVFILIAAVFRMHTILFLARNSVTVLATVAIVVLQPELRRALEKLGEKQFLASMMPFEKKKDDAKFSDITRESLIEAAFGMGSVKTGALMVIEYNTHLTEFENTGIQMDCIVSSQVLLNIFEHNTPLHDGAIIVRGDRIVAATCYLPLSDNMALSKELGTRHRAAVGMSEVSDALIIVVSEETGNVSVAKEGKIKRGISRDELREELKAVQRKVSDQKLINFWRKGRHHGERKIDE